MKKLILLLFSVFVSLLFFGNISIAQDNKQEKIDKIYFNNPLSFRPLKGKPAIFNKNNIAKDDVFLIVPFEHIRTAILKSDIRRSDLKGKNLILKSGAIGYWAGYFSQYNSFISLQSIGNLQKSEVWCFIGKNNKDKEDYACFIDSAQSVTYIPVDSAPYYFTNFSTYGNLFVDKLQIEEKKLEIAPNLEIQYVLQDISGANITIKAQINGKEIERKKYNINEQGEGQIDSPIGKINFSLSANKKSINLNLIEPKNILPLISDEQKIEKAKIFADMLEETAKENAKRKANIVEIIDIPPNQKEPILVPRYSLIATQNYRPLKAFKQKSSPLNNPKKYGDAGAILYETIYQPENNHVIEAISLALGKKITNTKEMTPAKKLLCWRDYEKLDKERQTPNIYALRSCLEDVDGDNKYEILYDFVPKAGTLLSVGSLREITKLDSKDNQPIEVENADNKLLPIETIGLFYMGANKLKLNSNNELYADSVQFEWRYRSTGGSLQANGELIEKIDIAINEKGYGELLDKNGNKLIEINNFKIDGSANIIFNDYFPIGPNSLPNQEKYLQKQLEIVAKIRASILNKSILK